MIKTPIPVFTLTDLASAGESGFEARPLDEVFATARRDVLAAHRHDYYSVFWCTGGRGSVIVDFTSYDIRSNVLCFLWPGQVHAWTLEEPPQGAMLSFTGAFYAGHSATAVKPADTALLYGVGGDAPVSSVNEAQSPEIQSVFDALLREFRGHRSDSEELIRSYLRVLLVLARRIQAAQNGSIHPHEAGLMLTKHFLQLVDTHFLTTSSVADYAALLSVTTSHLVATLTRTMGKPAGQIIRERLILEAKRLLRHSDLSIAEVAYHLKFDDPSYFSRFFKKHTENTPAQFRDAKETVTR